MTQISDPGRSPEPALGHSPKPVYGCPPARAQRRRGRAYRRRRERRNDAAAMAIRVATASSKPRRETVGAGAWTAVQMSSMQSNAGAHWELSVHDPPSGIRVLVGTGVVVAVRVAVEVGVVEAVAVAVAVWVGPPH
jgi:hypothetical protein